MKHLIPYFLIVLTLLGCKDPVPATRIDSPVIDLKYDNLHQFIIKKGKDEIAPSKFQWTSSDEKVGTVDSNGLFKARKIGQTKIRAMADGKTFESNVTISPYNTFVIEPILEFGLDEAAIRTKEIREFLTKSGNWVYFESASPSVRRVAYYFENDKSVHSLLLFQYTLENYASNIAMFGTYYNERYPNKENIGGKVAYVDDNKTLAIFYAHDDYIGYNTAYYPYKNAAQKIGLAKSFHP